MVITRLILKNWRNFRNADISLREYSYFLGANASGKSNLLDVFRFLRDISKPQGGGLQKAITDRGGITKLRCLHARHDTEVRIEVHLSPDFNTEIPEWEYSIGFKAEGKGAQRILISEEAVKHKGKHIIPVRPTKEDKKDLLRLTQTTMEQIQANAEFRIIPAMFSEVTYLHLVPQLVKYADMIGGYQLDDDPFGQGFLKAVSNAANTVRDSRLKKIEGALQNAVPQFQQLRFITDDRGRSHLEALYKHHRPKAGWQKEDQFSDGTLRLIGMLWSLLDSHSILLLEEPELSLNDAIVKQIPFMIKRVQKERKRRRQVIITTHSESLLSDKGIDARGVVILEPGPNGTTARAPNAGEYSAIKSGFSISEVILPKTRPASVDQLAFSF